MAEEARLWQRWCEGRDEQARALLLELHLPYAQVLAAQAFAGRRHEGVEFGDYLQFARVALMESFERFDPAMGTQFRTFAHRRIAGAIVSGLAGFGARQAGEQAAAAAPVVSRWLRPAEDLPGSVPDEAGDWAMLPYGEVAHIDDTALEQAALRQFRRRLPLWLPLLTQRERQVIRGHYLHDESFDTLARALGISNARVTQLHRRGLQRLRCLMLGAPS